MSNQDTSADALRDDLGEFSSIVCFKAVVVGVEDALGKRAAAVALKAAGRKRGHQIIESLDLAGRAPEPDTTQEMLSSALGVGGTRLCLVDQVDQDGSTFRVYTRETVCSAGEPQGSDRQCTYTLGAIHGAMEALYGVKLRGKHTVSVLRGGDHDIFEFEPR